MPRLFVANLHFEGQIAGDRQTLPVSLEERTAELAACWLPVCEPGDQIWCPRTIPDEFWEQMSQAGLPDVHGLSSIVDVPPNMELVPWGWSDAMRWFPNRRGMRSDAPPTAAVIRANSRRFSLELERRWGCGLERASEITTFAELNAALSQIGERERWVLKAEFSAAARQRIICTGPAPDPTSSAWIRKRIEKREWLCFEPWVERIAEIGLQWYVSRSDPPYFEGLTELWTDASGQYRGSVFGVDSATVARWQPAIDIARRAADAIQQLGYFGHVGIDAMRYRDAHGNEFLRPLQDINARWTMGRLALGWQRLMPHGTWRHGTVEEFRERERIVDGIVRTSPEIVGDRPARIATWLESDPVA